MGIRGSYIVKLEESFTGATQRVTVAAVNSDHAALVARHSAQTATPWLHWVTRAVTPVI